MPQVGPFLRTYHLCQTAVLYK